MKETGVYDRVLSKWMLKHPDCKPEPAHALGFSHLVSLFVVYGGGFAAAAVLFAVEWVVKGLTGERPQRKKGDTYVRADCV